jgi:pimeloyl-ACP methyl ester carboxylesterase
MRVLYFGLLIFAFLLCPYSGSAKINLGESVVIGGIKQWIMIKGARESDPVLLFLHGGPGGSAAYADQFTGELQKQFLVVEWDQRESGKTAKLNPSGQPLTVALFENDTFEMINYLRVRFSRNKIYLVGHSWGGFLGLAAAAKHPELIAGYFAISPMVHQVESERASLEFMKNKAKAENNIVAINELSLVKVPFEDGLQLYYDRKWLALLMGDKPAPLAFVEAWSAKWLTLFNEASQVNFFETAPEIKCPIYFFLGSNDYQTYFKLTEEYYRIVKADKKELFWFTDSGHLITKTEPKKLQKIILQQRLPNPVN